MERTASRLVIPVFCLVLLLAVCTCAVAAVVWEEDFESGLGAWSIDNGVWEVGQPCATPGPGGPHGGLNCAATKLCGNYPANIDSRLISPTISISTVTSGQELWLRFYEWFSYAGGDQGQVQISVRQPDGVTWSAWTLLSNFPYNSSGWGVSDIELTAYAGKTVRIAFSHTADGYSGEGAGWYLDDISISKTTPQLSFPEGFEAGWGGWHTEHGIWAVGTPTSGPGAAHTGTTCAATVLDGNYPSSLASRLISPTVTLPTAAAGEEVWLRFWEWFNYAGGDQGQIQISVRQSDGVTWSAWTLLSNFPYNSSGWGVSDVELTAYAGKTVRIGFYHTADGYSGQGAGWYLDDISISKTTPQLSSPEGFEAGWGGWHTDHGIWAVGTPTSGPGAAHTGATCAATVLDGNYPSSLESRLISPTVTLPTAAAGEEVWLRFWEWFSYAGGDQGYVQISVQQPDKIWGAWTTLSSRPVVYSKWSLCGVELTAYAGKTVRIALYLTADGYSGQGPGWYVDDISISKTTPQLPSPEGFESGWGGWATDNGIWQVGAPTSGPGTAHTGTTCAATVLDGNYPSSTDSRLISPTVQLPALVSGEEIWVRFWQWVNYAGGDSGQVQISSKSSGGSWSAWAVIATTPSNSFGWSRVPLDLTSYAGKAIRLAFYHTADGYSGEGPGWYIDDIKLDAPIANTIVKAKLLPDGDRAAIVDTVVSAVFPSYFYIQDDWHWPSSGLRVQWSGGGVSLNDRVNVAGNMGTRSEGERYLGATSAPTLVGSVSEVLPLGLNNRTMGGGDWNYNPLTSQGQMAVAGGMGLNNVGLLVRTWGKVSDVGSGFFYINDGSAAADSSRSAKVKVASDVFVNSGDMVCVTGASSCDSLLFDHFATATLDSTLWSVIKGTPTLPTSWLTLTNATGAGKGVDVRSKELFDTILMEVKAKSTGWKADTSLGFEYWDGTTHYGIVVTNGTLGIINKSKPLPNEVYIPIPDWATIRGGELIFTLRWRSNMVALDIKDRPASSVSYSGNLVPNRPMAVRFNVSNNLADALSIDYARTFPQRLIRPRDDTDVMILP